MCETSVGTSHLERNISRCSDAMLQHSTYEVAGNRLNLIMFPLDVLGCQASPPPHLPPASSSHYLLHPPPSASFPYFHTHAGCIQRTRCVDMFTVICFICSIWLDHLISASSHCHSHYLSGTTDALKIPSNFPMLQIKSRILAVHHLNRRHCYGLCHKCPSACP